MSNHRNRYHFYMVTAMVAYVRDGQPKSKHINVFSQLDDKKITAGVLNAARQGIIERVITQGDLSPEDIRDIVFINWSYLGFMTEKDFQDNEQQPKSGPVSSPYEH